MSKSGIIRQVNDLINHSMGRYVYVSFTLPAQPEYRRTYVTYNYRNAFTWEYDWYSNDGSSIEELLSRAKDMRLKFVEAGHISHDGRMLASTFAGV